MPQVKKYDMTGKEIGNINLPESVFAAKINKPIVHKVVTSQLAKVRNGNSSTKTRSEVRGGGRKPWRQKGTGRARHGSIRSPLWVGGGITFGPRPRAYDLKVSKKEKKLALRSVLTDKANTDNLLIIDKLEFNEPRTKNMVDLLEKLNLQGRKVVLVLPEKNENIYLSARNLPDVKTLVLSALNAYDLLNNDFIIIPEDALNGVEEVLAV